MEEMENGWYLLPKQKIIARKRIPFLSALAARLGFRRTRLIDLYSMIKRAYHSPNNISKMMAYSFPMEHDNFPKPDQYPSYFRLTGGWTLDKKVQSSSKMVLYFPKTQQRFLFIQGFLLGLFFSKFGDFCLPLR